MSSGRCRAQRALVTADEIKMISSTTSPNELRSRSPTSSASRIPRRSVDRALTNRQREYLHYITVSTNALLAIIDNILDLATIDAGAMKLNLSLVDIRKTMEAAVEGVQDRWSRTGSRSTFPPTAMSAASSPTNGGCVRSCSICCPTRSASRPPAARCACRPTGGPTR